MLSGLAGGELAAHHQALVTALSNGRGHVTVTKAGVESPTGQSETRAATPTGVSG